MTDVSTTAAERRRTSQSALLAGLVLIAGVVVLIWFAPDAYTIYKALHVVAAVIWVGGDITLTTLGIVFERRRDGETLGRIDRAAAAHGPESDEVGRRVRRLFTVFRFDTVLLLLVVLDMTVKPTF